MTWDVLAFRAMAVAPVIVMPAGRVFLNRLRTRFEEALFEVLILLELGHHHAAHHVVPSLIPVCGDSYIAAKALGRSRCMSANCLRSSSGTL